jgi:ketosteroid isomerase-like protein
MDEKMHEKSLILATQAASQFWMKSFNEGNAQGCASCYEQNALMVANPMGSFTGHEAILGFWKMLIEGGYHSVKYINPELKVLDENTVLLSSDWEMNKASGRIHKELWVKQSDGTMKLREDEFVVLKQF